MSQQILRSRGTTNYCRFLLNLKSLYNIKLLLNGCDTDVVDGDDIMSQVPYLSADFDQLDGSQWKSPYVTDRKPPRAGNHGNKVIADTGVFIFPLLL